MQTITSRQIQIIFFTLLYVIPTTQNLLISLPKMIQCCKGLQTKYLNVSIIVKSDWKQLKRFTSNVIDVIADVVSQIKSLIQKLSVLNKWLPNKVGTESRY